MSYRRHSRRRYRGPSAAAQHMRDRSMLTNRIANIDSDVLQIIYGLDDRKLVDLLAAYERAHGKKAADYMDETLPKWKSGKTGVSGQTASRLINLAPKFLTRDQRYGLLKRLYDMNKRFNQERHEVAVVLGHTPNAVREIEAAMQKLCSKPSSNRLPEDVQDTVLWVCDADSVAARQIMAAIETEESVLVASAGRSEVDRLMGLIARMDRSAEGTHYMQFPYGTLTVTVRQPTFFEKLGRAFKSA